MRGASAVERTVSRALPTRERSRRSLFPRRHAVGTLFANRWLDALAKSVLCFAATHELILLVHAALRRDAGAFNVFTMLEAQRLWPALGEPSAQLWSLAFLLAVYGVVFATLTRQQKPRFVAAPILEHLTPVAPARNGVATNGVAHAYAPAARASRLTAGLGFLALVAGLTVHMGALAAIEQFVPAFPPVPDVVHAWLPYVDFGVPGELAFGAYLCAMVVVLLRRQAQTVPAILVMLGVFYAVRGVFLFVLPIGMPPTAPALGERFVLWPFAGHAYFPGGHTGIMTVMGLSVISAPWRRAFLAFAAVFALGTMLARTHYTADAIGGALVAYTIVLWGRRRFGARAGGIAARRTH